MRSWIHFILPATSLVSLIAIRLGRAQRQLLRDLQACAGSSSRSGSSVSFSGNDEIESQNSLTVAGHGFDTSVEVKVVPVNAQVEVPEKGSISWCVFGYGLSIIEAPGAAGITSKAIGL